MFKIIAKLLLQEIRSSKQVTRFNSRFHEDVMFCDAKTDRNQHSSSEDPSVANIVFGDVNETELCNEPFAILNEETVNSQLSPLRRSA